jgi:glycosyltransferase involved in cell wall biosynthesis
MQKKQHPVVKDTVAIDNRRTRKIRIMYVINDLDIGGAQRLLINVLNYLDDNVFDVYVYNLNYSSSSYLRDELFKTGAKLYDFSPLFLGDFRCILPLYKCIKRERIDVVHTHLCLANLWGTIAARLAGIKAVMSTEHNTSTWQSRPLYYRYAARLYSELNCLLVCVSGAVQAAVRHISPRLAKKSIVIHNGIDTETFRYSPSSRVHISKDKPFRIGTLIRDDPRKGYDVYRECAFLFRDDPIVEFSLGTQKADHKTDSLIKVKYLQPTTPSVVSYLESLDVFVLPSREEGLGLVLLEAMAVGIPIIASNVGGIREVVEHRFNGLLFSSGSAIELYHGIEELKMNQTLRHRIVENGLRTVREKFDGKGTSASLMTQYMKLSVVS